MGNHPDQFRNGTLYSAESDVSGAAGAFKTKEKGTLAYPTETSHGVRLWSEEDSILNTACAYVLLALGRASRLQGATLIMPAWGLDGSLAYPNGVTITLLNRDVLVLRPLGYRPMPAKPLTLHALSVPSADYFLYIGSGPRHNDDLAVQCAAANVKAEVVMIDVLIRDEHHNITIADVKSSIIKAVESPDGGRCRGALISITCRTWSIANFLPGMHGNPGRPWRDESYPLGIPRDGVVPAQVLRANVESENAAAIATAVALKDGFVMVETPARRTGPKAIPRHVLPDCSRAVHMFDHPAWSAFAQATNSTEHVWDQCMTAADPSKSAVKSSVWLCTPNMSDHVRKHFGTTSGSLCNHPPGTHRALRGTDDNGTYVTSSSK